MKVLFAFLVICIVGAFCATLTDEQKQKLKGYKEACIAETGVDKAVIDAIGKGGPIKRDSKLDCYAACLLKKSGVMKEDGTLDIEAVRTKAATINADQEKVKKVIDKCKDLSGKDTCEKGGNILTCFFENKDIPILD
ncbi:general odorant-binding protein 56d-like [Copidosoma floridanum]|uniref:general odorant-binding protein 56d-like n=1 Tax=Copidosoma floridanum TaxID=29053 RepID=UPI0006C948D4|nr:general odorant-binding protein 56d-like [Copidosoma floridanum]